jgi:hypothetical protein
MATKSREKIALIFFFCLAITGLGGLIGYLSLGHNWNVAATNIDDATGTMSGYTVLVFEGLLPGETCIAPHAPGSQKDEASGSVTGPALTLKTKELLAKALLSVNETTSVNKTSALNPTLTLADVERSYTDKQASVFGLDVKNSSYYHGGIIVKRGNHRFGVFSIDKSDSYLVIEKKILYLTSQEVDFIVAITPSKELVEKIDGIDIALSTKDENLFVMGETINSTFYVDSCESGAFGVVYVSPSNVVSAKVVRSL